MGAKVKKSLRRTMAAAALFCVVSVAVTQAEDVSGSFVLSRARRSPQWQYSKNGGAAPGGRVGDAASGGNVRFLNLFNTNPGYDQPYHHGRPGGHYGGGIGGASGQGTNFGFSLNYGQQNYHHRPNYGGGHGGGFYDPHYDHHSHGYHDHHHHHNSHAPPYAQYPHRPPYGGGAPPYQHYPYQPPGGFHGGFPPGYYHGRSAGASKINAASESSPKKE